MGSGARVSLLPKSLPGMGSGVRLSLLPKPLPGNGVRSETNPDVLLIPTAKSTASISTWAMERVLLLEVASTGTVREYDPSSVYHHTYMMNSQFIHICSHTNIVQYCEYIKSTPTRAPTHTLYVRTLLYVHTHTHIFMYTHIPPPPPPAFPTHTPQPQSILMERRHRLSLGSALMLREEAKLCGTLRKCM